MSTLVKPDAARRRVLATPRRGERGVVMFVALVVLIVMTLAGLAMLRQMRSGVSIAGNVAFKQGATAVADAGIEAGRAFIRANANPDADAVANGYFATWAGNPDLTSLDWKNRWDALAPTLVTSSGEVRYIVQRLCSQATPANAGGQECSDFVPKNCVGQSKGGAGPAFECPSVPFYRITAQVLGPRRTVSYTQVVMH